jgi:hypothetical protein
MRTRVSSKQSVYSVRTETNRNSICFACFSVCFAKPKIIFSVCFFVSDRYRNNRNKQNFVETNRKNLQKAFSIRGSQKQLIFFLGSNRNNPELNQFQLFLCLFSRKQKKFFGLFWCFGPVSNQPKQTELIVWGIKRGLDFNKFAGVSVGLLFVLVVSKHRNSLFR